MQDANVRPRAAAPTPTCPACGKEIDPLRAGQVSIESGRFVYFCNATCKQDAFEERSSRIRETLTADPPQVVAVDLTPISNSISSPLSGRASLTQSQPVSGERSLAREIAASDPDAEEPFEMEPPIPTAPTTLRSIPVDTKSRPILEQAKDDRDAEEDDSNAREARNAKRVADRRKWLDLLSGVGVGAGLLAAALVLGGPGAEAARVPLAAIAVAALIARVLLMPRDPSSPHVISVLFAPTAALALAAFARLHANAHASSMASLAGLAAAGSLFLAALIERAFETVREERAAIAKALSVDVRVVKKSAKEDEIVSRPSNEIKPGEHVVVEAGDVVGVDALVVAGKASVLPWLGAHVEAQKTEGDAIVAGAKIVSGRLRLVTTWGGDDRAWLRLTSSTSRLEASAPLSRFSRMLVERAAPVAACAVGGVVLANGASILEAIATALAASIALGAWGVSRVVALHHARVHALALAHGVVFKDPRSLYDAGASDIAVVCARGTVLMGEPEIVALEAVGNVEADRVLSLAAGAETVSEHPFASAILRAARARAVRAESVRNASVHDGLGVTALSAAGEQLVVGGRALLLRERISVAGNDARVSELEAEGRSVLLVALGSKLIGIIALQDGLRAGARGAIQRLHDARIEPVLMSGEARETCETIARALDIDHVRPEIPPNERGAQVRALREGGHVVAVLGHPDADDAALGAADIAVAMASAGATPGEWSVALASDDVRDSAFALKLARGLRDRARTALLVGFAPSAIAALALAFAVVPLSLAPIAVVAGTLAALGQARPRG
jgi:cation transport ATPase